MIKPIFKFGEVEMVIGYDVICDTCRTFHICTHNAWERLVKAFEPSIISHEGRRFWFDVGEYEFYSYLMILENNREVKQAHSTIYPVQSTVQCGHGGQ